MWYHVVEAELVELWCLIVLCLACLVVKATGSASRDLQVNLVVLRQWSAPPETWTKGGRKNDETNVIDCHFNVINDHDFTLQYIFLHLLWSLRNVGSNLAPDTANGSSAMLIFQAIGVLLCRSGIHSAEWTASNGDPIIIRQLQDDDCTTWTPDATAGCGVLPAVDMFPQDLLGAELVFKFMVPSASVRSTVSWSSTTQHPFALRWRRWSCELWSFFCSAGALPPSLVKEHIPSALLNATGRTCYEENQIQKCSEVKSNMQSAFQFPAGLSSIFCCKDCLRCQACREGFNDFCKQGAASSDQEPSHHPRPESDKVQVDHPRNVEALDWKK